MSATKDSIQHFERARVDRFQDGLCLWLHPVDASHSGAAYLLGFSVEIALKAAYFRVLGHGLVDDIDKNHLVLVKGRHPTHLKEEAFHSLMFWAHALQDLRTQVGRPYPGIFAHELARQSQTTYNRWRVEMRYRANMTSAHDLEVLVTTASWFDRNYDKLHT